MQRKSLAEDNIRLAFYMVRKYRSPFVDLEDIQGTALLGLVKASAEYDPEKGIKFATFASVVIQNEILQLLRREYKQKAFVRSLNEEISDGLTLEDMLPDNRSMENSIMAKAQLEDLWKRMDAREKKVVWMIVAQGLPQKTVGKSLHISQSMVSRILRDIKKGGNYK